MPSVDVAVVGVGLSGLATGVALAETGARVFVAGKGMAATHWTHAGLDLGAPAGARTARDGIAALAARPGHPYRLVAGDVGHGLAALSGWLDAAGLPYVGDLDAPFASVVTPIGGVRPLAVAPRAQGAALAPWRPGEGLLLIGFDRFRDAWAEYAARNARRVAWSPTGPAEIRGATVTLPALDRLHNLTSLDIARFFDDGSWRARALAAIAGAVPRSGTWRIGLPAVLGQYEHATVHAEAERAVGHPVFEVPGLPPSVPGVRMFEALRSRLLAAGGRFQFGFPVVRVERAEQGERRLVAVHTESASRTLRIAADRFVLATGGIAGGGLRGERDGTLRDTVLGVALPGPDRKAWFADDFVAAGHPIEAAGFTVDEALRPLDAAGAPLFENVHVVGSALGGMRYLTERCGDGVAIASAARVARSAIGPVTSSSASPLSVPGAARGAA